MRVHCCLICRPDVGKFLRSLQIDDVRGTPISPEQLEGEPKAQAIVAAWHRRDVPKVFR